MKKQIVICILVLVAASLACGLKSAASMTPSVTTRPQAATTTPSVTTRPQDTSQAVILPQGATLAACVVGTGISGGSLNIRQAGLMDAPVVGTVAEGDALVIIGTAGAWLKVQSSAGLTGYVNSTFCK